MTIILQATFSNVFLWNNIVIFILFSQKFVLRGSVDNESALVIVQAWYGAVILHGLNGIMAWISNYTHSFMSGVP